MVTQIARDNQWWFSESPLRGQVEGSSRITLRINGRACRLVRSESGKDARPTFSFKFVNKVDRDYWCGLRGQQVTIELLEHLEGEPPLEVSRLSPCPVPPHRSEDTVFRLRAATPAPVRSSPSGLRSAALHPSAVEDSLLCIGLDIAWWGGARSNRDSQFDCLAFVERRAQDWGQLRIERIPLAAHPAPSAERTQPNFDADGRALVDTIGEVVSQSRASRVLLAIDAPLRARERSLPPRQRAQEAGQSGQLARRECDHVLAAAMSEHPSTWRYNIQPGAPLAPRVAAVVKRLQVDLGFDLYADPVAVAAAGPRLSFEAFPNETLWLAGIRGYHGALSSKEVGAYKHSTDRSLPLHVFMSLVASALAGVGPLVGVHPWVWNGWVVDAVRFLASDPAWLDSAGVGRGGKLLDDAVDAVLCCAAAVSFAQGQAHVWMGADPTDGHIIGPGL